MRLLIRYIDVTWIRENLARIWIKYRVDRASSSRFSPSFLSFASVSLSIGLSDDSSSLIDWILYRLWATYLLIREPLLIRPFIYPIVRLFRYLSIYLSISIGRYLSFSFYFLSLDTHTHVYTSRANTNTWLNRSVVYKLA